MLAEALQAARANVRDDWRLASVLRELAPHLPAELLRQALEAASGLPDWKRVSALSDLFPHSPAQLLDLAPEARPARWATTEIGHTGTA